MVKPKLISFVIVFVVFSVVFASFISAAAIQNDLHLNIQTVDGSGNVVTGTFAFVFNISTTSNCGTVVYSNSTSLTTDARGIISYYLNNVNLSYDNQYYLCYYRDGTLVESDEIARTPYAFRARNVTLSGVEIDQNFNLGGYNLTASYLFGDGSGLTNLNVSQINLTNYVPYTGAIKNLDLGNNNFSVGTSDLFVDNVLGRVGIGTGSPTAKLDVNGTIIATDGSTSVPSYAFNGSTNTGLRRTASGSIAFVVGGTDINYYNSAGFQSGLTGSATSPSFSMSGDGNTGLYFPAADNFALTTNGTERLRINENGNVGIGTSSPSSLLDLSSVASSSALSLSDSVAWSVGDTREIKFRHYDGGDYRTAKIASIVPGGSKVDLAFSSYYGGATSEVMRITGGNVGIGITSPASKLHVNGSAIINGTLIGLSNATDVTGAVTLAQLQAVNVSATASETDPYWTGNSTLVPYLASANTFTNNNVFNGNVSLGTGSLFVNNNTGYVGIGTASPSYQLHVQGDAASNGARIILTNQYHEDATGGTAIQFFGGTSDTTNVQIGYITAGKEQTWTTTGSTQDGYLAFGTESDGTGTEKMRITSAGNVGIGTSSPLYTLDVNKSVNNDWVARIINPSTTEPQGLLVDTPNVAGTYGIFGVKSNGNYRFIVNGNGNVGIGTSSPQEKLTLNSSTGQTLGLRGGNGANNSIRFTENTDIANNQGAYLQLVGGSNRFDIGTVHTSDNSGADRPIMTFTYGGTGNVGIGTTSPQNKLNVVGDINVTSTEVSMFFEGTAMVIAG